MRQNAPNIARGRGVDRTKPAWMNASSDTSAAVGTARSAGAPLRQPAAEASAQEKAFGNAPRPQLGAGRGTDMTRPAWMNDASRMIPPLDFMGDSPRPGARQQLPPRPPRRQQNYTHPSGPQSGAGRGVNMTRPAWMADEERERPMLPSRPQQQQSEEHTAGEAPQLMNMVGDLIDQTAAEARANEYRGGSRQEEIPQVDSTGQFEKSVPRPVVLPPSRRPPVIGTPYQSFPHQRRPPLPSPGGPPSRIPPSRAPPHFLPPQRYPSSDSFSGPLSARPSDTARQQLQYAAAIHSARRGPTLLDDDNVPANYNDYDQRPSKLQRRDNSNQIPLQEPTRMRSTSDNAVASEDLEDESKWRDRIRNIQNHGSEAYKNNDLHIARDKFEDALEEHARHCRRNQLNFARTTNRVPSHIHADRDKLRVKLLNYLARTLEKLGDQQAKELRISEAQIIENRLKDYKNRIKANREAPSR